MPVMIHPSAEIDSSVEIGDGTRVWAQVHVRGPSRIGKDCILGEKSYVAYDVEIGDRVKINAFVYICSGTRIENGVMLAAGVILTNDRFPRAATPDLTSLLPSEPDEHTGTTRVGAGATIGAGARIGPDLTIGRFAMVGMASVVTKDVEAHHLVVGNPARSVGLVCRCGLPLHRWADGDPALELMCKECGSRLLLRGREVVSDPGPGA